MDLETCRICCGNTKYLFEKEHLGKYSVRYFACQECSSAQTEKPYWIKEAHERDFNPWDTGICERTLYVGQLTVALALLQCFSREDLCLDIGDPTGLLTRNLRDVGLNAYYSGVEGKNVFSNGFEKPLAAVNDVKLITAFEIFEHYPQPQEAIKHLFEKRPEFLFSSTKVYRGQDASWWYFVKDGQHVQFYSLEGLDFLAKKHGYHLSTDGYSYHLFSKQKLPRQIMQKIIRLAAKANRRARRRWPSRIQEDHEKMLKENAF